ncbi:glycosyl hydrolase 108 family protein [Mesorhizobium captivum]
MVRNFRCGLAFVLKSEGRWSDTPVDSGGATKKALHSPIAASVRS